VRHWWVVLAMLVVLPLAPRHVPQVASARGQIVTASYSLPPDVGESPAIVTLPEKPAARWPVVIFAFWAAVLLYRLGRIGQSFVYLRGVKRNAVVSCVELPDVERRARVLVSREITSPMAVWFLHPAVILPTDLSGQIMPEELDQIVLHRSRSPGAARRLVESGGAIDWGGSRTASDCVVDSAAD